MIFGRKIHKIPEFLRDICPKKMPEFYTMIARKLFFPDFFGKKKERSVHFVQLLMGTPVS